MDVMLDIVDFMSSIKWCDVIKCGCVVIYSAYWVIHIEAVMTYIHFFELNWNIVCHVKNTLRVMSGIMAVKAHNGCVVITLRVRPYQVNMS